MTVGNNNTEKATNTGASGFIFEMKSLRQIVEDRDLDAAEDCPVESLPNIGKHYEDDDLFDSLLQWILEESLPTQEHKRLLFFTKMLLRGRLIKGLAVPELFHKSDDFSGKMIATLQRECMLDPAYAQSASQILFYSNFQLMNNYVVDHFPVDCYKTSDISLALSLTRNVHNILITDTDNKILDTMCSPGVNKECPWIQTDRLNLQDILNNILRHCLYEQDPEHEKIAHETTVEILRCYYAANIPITQDLLRPSIERRSTEIQTAALATLSCVTTDLLHSYVDQLREQKLLPDILKCLDTALQKPQVFATDVLSIETVLYKCCRQCPDFCSELKQYIFPPSEVFAKLVQEQTSINMSPLDAPPNTSRYLLIQQLTHHDSNIKRVTGELLWLLCDCDAKNFVQRVGMGNSVAILQAKGIVNLS